MHVRDRVLPCSLALAGFLPALGLRTAAAQPAPAVPSVAIADSVRGVVRALAASFGTRKGRDLLPILRPDSTFRFTFGGQTLTYGQYRDLLLRPTGGRWRSVELHYDSIQVTLLAPDVAAVTALGSEALTDAAGAVHRLPNASTMVWARGPGGWQLVTMAHTEGQGRLEQR
jgi:hypothetical protein